MTVSQGSSGYCSSGRCSGWQWRREEAGARRLDAARHRSHALECVARVAVAAHDPEHVRQMREALTHVAPVALATVRAVCDHLVVPAFGRAAVARPVWMRCSRGRRGRGARRYPGGRLLDDPDGVVEVGVVRRREIGFDRKRLIAIDRARHIRSEDPLDQIDDDSVEATRCAVVEVELDLLARRTDDDRPRGVPVEQERRARGVDQMPAVRRDREREGGRHRCMTIRLTEARANASARAPRERSRPALMVSWARCMMAHHQKARGSDARLVLGSELAPSNNRPARASL